MSEKEFHRALIIFINNLLAPRKLSTKESLIFYIELQPNSGSFGGTIVNNKHERPLNLFSIPKEEHNEFMNKIYSFHTANTNNGLNKWNEATFSVTENGHITSNFNWNEEREQSEREQANKIGATTSKWYWE